MTLAVRIEEVLRLRAEREAARTAARAALDAFIQAQFPVLNARLAGLLRDVAGVHTRVTVTEQAQTLAVIGRTFATLPQTILTVAATLDAAPRTVRFEPTLEFRSEGQFGRIQCTTNFDVRLRRSRPAELAHSLLDIGIEMRGAASAHMLIVVSGAWVELSHSHLEDALNELLLR